MAIDQKVEKRKKESPEDKAKRKRDREINDVRVVASTPEGRRFLWRLLSEGKIFQDGYVHGDAGFGTTYNCGRRSIGVWALSELMEASPNTFLQMQNENASEAKREEIEQIDEIFERDVLNFKL